MIRKKRQKNTLDRKLAAKEARRKYVARHAFSFPHWPTMLSLEPKRIRPIVLIGDLFFSFVFFVSFFFYFFICVSHLFDIACIAVLLAFIFLLFIFLFCFLKTSFSTTTAERSIVSPVDNAPSFLLSSELFPNSKDASLRCRGFNAVTSSLR